MTAKRFECKNKMPYYFINNLVLLKNFGKNKLKVTAHDCVDRNVYHIDYVKDLVSNPCPLHLVISEFYGHVKESDRGKYLIATQIGNNLDVLQSHKRVWGLIIDRINKMSGSEYVFKDECHKFKLSSIKCCEDVDDFDEMPVGVLLKFSFVVVSCRLVIEKDGELILETYLEQCFYEKDDEIDYDSDWEII